MDSSFFLGRDGFQWFLGVVEDRNDPERLGRVRVRVLGYHTEDKLKIKTEDLPWSSVMMPCTTPSMNGLGESLSWLTPGTWVVGFFKDPQYLQEPIIMGTLTGKPADVPDPLKGFNDPHSPDSEEEIYAVEPDYGPYPLRTGESDVNRLGVPSETHPNVELRDSQYTTEVPTANENPIVGSLDLTVDSATPYAETVNPDGVNGDPTAVTWSEPRTTDPSLRGLDASGINTETNEARLPKLRKDSEYPYNHVYESESGHIREVDDTPYAERVLDYHRTGTFTETDADGNKVTRVVNNNYEIVYGSNFVNVKGDVNLTVDSNCKTYIKGDWEIQVDGNKHEVVKGNVTEEYGSDIILNTHTTTLTGFRSKTIFGLENENVVGAVTHLYGGIKLETVAGNSTLDISGNYDVDAPRIDLN